ncbi:CotH kinase family protein [Lachnospiraceae bacterium C1.1]|nr:CotH kinase family protein [Lachnospiraceae bacterium C1.1]
MKYIKKRFTALISLFLIIIVIFAVYRIEKKESASNASSLPEMFSFNLNGSGNYIDLYYDEHHSSDTWYLFIPSNADLERSTIEFSGCEKIVFEDINGNKFEQKNGERLAQGLNSFESYYMEFMDENGNETERRIFQYMQSENVASMFIETESGSMEKINADKTYQEAGKLCLYNSEGGLEYQGEIASLKGRGNTSWELEKKPYRVKLNEPHSLCGLKSSDKWVLLANCLDKSNIRNKTVNGFAKAMGFKETTSSVYVDLYLNGKYNGIYELSEKVQVASGNVDIEDLDIQNEQLNSKKTSSYPQTVVSADSPGERRAFDLDRNPTDISGGYLIEKNYEERYERFPSRFRTVSGEKYCIRSPEIASKEEVDYIADLVNKIEKTAAEGGDVSNLIELKSFADKYLLEEFVDNEASGATSSFFYKYSDAVDPLLHAGPPWDYDKTLENLMPGELDDVGRLTYLTNHGNGTRIFYNLFMNCEEYRDKVYEEYCNVMEPMLNDYIENEGWNNNEYSEIDDRMDMMRWTSTPESTAEEIEKIADFIKSRKELFDKIFKDNGKLCTVHFVGDFANRDPYYGYSYGSELGELPYIKEKEGLTAVWVNSKTGEELTETTIVTDERIEAEVMYK